jgi:hypothetical protein
MEAIIASLKNLCRIKLSDSEYVDLAINSIGIENLIEQAEAGDKDAEKRVRHLAACCLNSDDFVPLREYAERVFERLNKGLPDPNRPGGGRPLRTYRDKLRIAHWIYKAIKQRGVSQNRACAAYVEHKSSNEIGPEAISPEAVRKIYREVLPDIEKLYEEVPKIKATVVPIRCAD